jgi:hypothetical protein
VGPVTVEAAPVGPVTDAPVGPVAPVAATSTPVTLKVRDTLPVEGSSDMLIDMPVPSMKLPIFSIPILVPSFL